MDDYDLGIMFEHEVEETIKKAVWNALNFGADASRNAKQMLADSGIEWDVRYSKYVLKHIDTFYEIPLRRGTI